MDTGDHLLKELVDVESYLEHALEQFEEADYADIVPQRGPGRSWFLSEVNRFKAALEAVHFVQEVIAQRPTDELLEGGKYLDKALKAWRKRVQAHNHCAGKAMSN